jgi:Contractile injection system tube protein/LysM domain
MAASGSVASATITNLDTGTVVECMFRPDKYAFQRTNNWAWDGPIGSTPKLSYNGSEDQELELDLIFDTYEPRPSSYVRKPTWSAADELIAKDRDKRDVREITKWLWAMMLLSPFRKEQRTGKSTPPHVRFQWGKLLSFIAVIRTLSETFTLFLPDGTPVRSRVKITFAKVSQAGLFPSTNPTSGGPPGYEVHMVRDGETIDLIAFQRYGDSGAWRHLADTNRLDDPDKLRAGQRLLIVPLSE